MGDFRGPTETALSIAYQGFRALYFGLVGAAAAMLGVGLGPVAAVFAFGAFVAGAFWILAECAYGWRQRSLRRVVL